MKQKTFFSAILVSAFLFSCGNGSMISSVNENTVEIIFADDICFSMDQYMYQLSQGDDLQVRIMPEEGFIFSSCSYSDYDYVINEDKSISLTLKQVLFSERVTLDVVSESHCICYDPNGGTLDADNGNDNYFCFYPLEHHKRANTELGTAKMHRDGYVQTGWNTSADGSGTHIGLGSRVTLGDDVLILYAEWAKETDESYFTAEDTVTGVKITGYTGPAEIDTLVIPHTIRGRKTTSIGGRAFQNLKVRNFILNENMQMLFSNAIINCSIENLMIFDSITDSYGDSVTDGSYHHLYINAMTAPRHQADNDNARFADDVDSLILSQGEKRLLFYGGCSMSYGMNCPMMEEAFPEYKALNLGVIGGTNAAFAFDVMSQYVTSSDVFVHAPEVASPYQLMKNTDAESRMFVEIEGNYDLMSLVDVKSIKGIFSAFHAYQNARVQMTAGSYDDYLSHYDDYGDICIDRSEKGTDTKYTKTDEEYTYILDYTTEDAISALAGKYDLLKEKGTKVYFSFSPVNRSGLSVESISDKVWKTFEANEKDGLAKYGYSVISEAEKYLYMGRCFYDTDYHLNDAGVKLRVNQLIEDLKAVL